MRLPNLRRWPTRWRVAATAFAAAVLLMLLGFCADRSDPDQTATGQPAATPPVSAPTDDRGDDRGDDGATDPEPTAPPTAAPPTAGPNASTSPRAGTAPSGAGLPDPRVAARTFLVRYLNTSAKSPEEWRASFAGLVTDGLRAELETADPANVPAGRTGPLAGMSATVVGDDLVLVAAPVVGSTGQPVATVKVTVVARAGRWLVSDLDMAQR